LPAGPQAAPEPQQLPVKEKPPVPGNPPASVQREMPGISLSFLVYSDNAAERMVSINGKMMREGQEISPDMKLDEITPNGVILSYRGHRFHKNLF
jgi:general secretion pathway protein B